MAKDKKTKEPSQAAEGPDEEIQAAVAEFAANDPELFEAVRAQAKAEFEAEQAVDVAAMTVAEFKAAYADFYNRIVAEVVMASKPADLKIPGFLLDIGDPFAEGAARVYAKAKGIDPVRLPIVLPRGKAASIVALKNYVIRAEGGGDTERAAKAKKELPVEESQKPEKTE